MPTVSQEKFRLKIENANLEANWRFYLDRNENSHKSASKLFRGTPGSTREHCSDDARDISELETKEEECSRYGEVLRVECNLLQMEKEVAEKRWEQGCVEMEHAIRMAHLLHSVVQTLVTVRLNFFFPAY
eukprot:Gb_07404 [translate_table: standard]